MSNHTVHLTGVRQIISSMTKVGLILILLAVVNRSPSLAKAPGSPQDAEIPQALLDPSVTCDAISEIPTTECLALEALYNETGGADWANNTGWWETTTPCSWYGVVCSSGHVQSLTLYSNHLSGSIPAELGNLANLQILLLSNNQLSGSIPATLGSLVNLESIHLSNNQLSGGIPTALGSLANLETLLLGNNQLSGSIPAGLGSLVNLETLHIGSNQLSGGIPTALGSLANLRNLLLFDNLLTGSIPPVLGNLLYLRTLNLSNNQLSGSLPAELENLANLTNLNLSTNHLGGAMPLWLGSLTHLEYLVLNNNQLSGSLPPALGSLADLQVLLLFDNQLTGDIPASIANLASLTLLNLAYNCFTASDPALVSFLEIYEPDWFATQTVPPADLQAVTDSSHINLSWTPIPYTRDGGYYEISYATAPGGPYTVHGVTPDKYASRYAIAGLLTDEYYFRVRTFTPAHDDQQNDLMSGYTQPVSAIIFTLGIEKSDLGWVHPGEPITYTLTVANNSMIGMTNLLIQDTIPTGATYLRGGTRVGDVVHWSVPTLGPLATVAVQFVVTAAQTITNSDYRVTADGGYIAVGQTPVVTIVSNSLCGIVDEIPLSECEALLALYNSTGGPEWTDQTGWLHTNTPCSWYGVACEGGHVSQVALMDNQLSGGIPPEINALPGLQALYLHNNRLGGSLPAELGSLSNLNGLLLHNNKFNGIVPPCLINLTGLELLDLGYNSLSTSDAAVISFLSNYDPDWFTSQTVPPKGLQTSAVTADSVTVSWTPIAYDWDDGYYEVFFAAQSGGPFTFVGHTNNKTASTYTHTGLQPGTTYYIRLRTFTPAHDYQQNDLWSDTTPAIPATTSPPPVPVEANFSADPTFGLAPLEVEFTNLSTGDFDTCSWTFGDGGTHTGCTPLVIDHTYTFTGTFTAVLTVSGPGGTDCKTRMIEVGVTEPTKKKVYLPLVLSSLPVIQAAAIPGQPNAFPLAVFQRDAARERAAQRSLLPALSFAAGAREFWLKDWAVVP